MALQVNPKFLNNNTNVNNNKVRTSSTNTNKLSVNPKFLQSNISPIQMSPTPVFKTLEEAQEYAKNNNIKVSSPTRQQVNKITAMNKPQALNNGTRIEINEEDKDYYLNNLKSFKNTLDVRESALNLAKEKYNNATDEEKETALQNLKEAEESYNEKLKDYNTALAYERMTTNKMNLFGKNIVGNVAQGTANILNTANRNFDNNSNALTGSSVSNIDAQKLYEYSQNPNNPQAKINAMISLTALSKQNTESAKKVAKEISNGTFKGTVEDIKRILNDSQIENYEEDKLLKNTYKYMQNVNDSAQNIGLNDTERMIYNATGVVANQLPTMAMTMINPALGNYGIYANAGQSAFDEAINNGATYNQATANAMLSGGAELGVEKLSGGLSNKLLGSKALFNPSNLTKGIGNKVVKGIVDTGLDVIGEGLEEVATTALQPVIDRITYNPNAEFAAGEELWSSFRDSILPTLLMQGIGATANGINRYYNKQVEQIQNSNLPEEQKTELINKTTEEKDKIINEVQNTQQPVQNVAPQSPNIQIQQQTNEVIPQQNENGQNANLVQNNINNQKVDNRPTLDLRKIAQSYIEEGNISEKDKQILRETIDSATDEEINGDLLYGLRNTIKEQEQKNALYGQNNTQIVKNTPKNVQISQNNVQNAQDLQKTGQNTAKGFIGTLENEFGIQQSKERIRKLENEISTGYYTDEYVKELNNELKEEKSFLETLERDIENNIELEINNKKSNLSEEEKQTLKDFLEIKELEREIKQEKEKLNNMQGNMYYTPFIESQKEYIKDLERIKKAMQEDYIRNDADGKKYLYDILNIKKKPSTSKTSQSASINNILPQTQNYVNNQQKNFPTQAEQQQAQQELRNKLPTEESRLNMKKPKLEDITELTEKEAQLPTMTYKQKADKNTPYRRKFWDNVESSKIVSKDVKERVNMTNYERKHNNDVLEKMKDRLDTEPMKVVQEWFKKDIKKATEQDVALGAILLERYQAEGRIEEAVDVVEKLADMGTEAGRAVQMYSIFQRLTPEGMMMYQQRKLNNALESLTQKQTGKWVEQNKDKFKLTEEDATFITAKVQEAQNAPTERQKQIALAEIESRINDKLPPEAGQSVKAFRRIAMLFNPKTQVRNIVGNVTVMPLNYVTDLVATGIDKAIAKKTGVRTTALPNAKTIGKGAKKGLSETIDDYKRGIRTSPTGSKYEIQENAKSFNENTDSKVKNAINRKLNGIDRFLSAVMEAGDRPFYEASYQNALEGQMKANGVTEPTQDMIDIASNVALSQTWQDNNNYTQAVLGIRSAFNKININGFGLGDLIIPFAKTPANLTKAMVEYSPAGMIPSIINYNDMQKAISRGDMTPMQQKKFVTSVGKAVAGTLLYTLAGALVQGGAVTGSSDEDKDVANFEKNVLGIQPYSIKMGDKTFTYNWAQPLATPFAIMADTKNMTAEGAKLNEILVNAFKVAGDQLVANSFLQGIQELLSSEYGNESAMDNLVGAIMDLPTQFTPTLLGQIATQFDSTKRQTFENGDTVGTMWNEVKNKLPGAKNTLAPQVNTFGEDIQNYGGDNNAFNVFLNPGNISSTNATDTQKELYKLYQDTKDKTIFPAQAPYSISGSGEKVRLSSKDRAEYQKTSGKFVSENLEALFDSEYYKSLDNDKKAEVVNAIVTDANTLAKGEYLETKASKELKEKLSKLGDIPVVEYYNAWSATRGIESDKNWKGESISGSKKKKQIQAINNAISKDLTTKQREILYGLLNVSGY